MKVFNTVMKVVTALAAVAGALYVVATYGDKIVAWAKSLMEKYGRCGVHYFNGEEETDFVPAPPEKPAEEPAAAPAEEPAEEPAAEPDQAEEEDFEAKKKS